MTEWPRVELNGPPPAANLRKKTPMPDLQNSGETATAPYDLGGRRVLFRHRERCPLQRQALQALLRLFDLFFNSSNFLHRRKTRVVTSGVNVFQMLHQACESSIAFRSIFL